MQAVYHFYAVTNRHVAVNGKASTIRLNTLDDGHEIISLQPNEWAFIPGGDDVAVVRLDLDYRKHKFSAIPTHQFMRQIDHLRLEHLVGPGEDVFMVGRFVDHDGGITNQPAVRFGCISIMPSMIPTEFSKQPKEYYSIDMHSRSGFSGSPVFAYRTFGQDLDGRDMSRLYDAIKQMRRVSSWDFKPRMWLLGIQHGQFPEYWEIETIQEMSGSTKQHIVGLSGMTLVSPASKILECLELPELKQQRETLNSELFNGKNDLPPIILEDES
jgi:hypothetical protein